MKNIVIKPKSFFKVLTGTSRSQVAEMVLGPKEKTGGPLNMHPESDQWLYVVSGKGKAVIEGKTTKFKKGDLLLIEARETHEIINESNKPLRTFSIYAPPEY
jgi:mannose-6-phosphate isomerase-like protein (cupin superfamily)